MPGLILWHGSASLFDAFDARLCGGGIHLGTEAQARMRNSAVLYRVEVEAGRSRRSRDEGGGWAARIRSARGAGLHSIVYLNRWEGIPAERIAALAAAGDLARLDRLPDAAFRRLVPEARGSLLVWDPGRLRILERLEARPPAAAPHAPEERLEPAP